MWSIKSRWVMSQILNLLFKNNKQFLCSLVFHIAQRLSASNLNYIHELCTNEGIARKLAPKSKHHNLGHSISWWFWKEKTWELHVADVDGWRLSLLDNLYLIVHDYIKFIHYTIKWFRCCKYAHNFESQMYRSTNIGVAWSQGTSPLGEGSASLTPL